MQIPGRFPQGGVPGALSEETRFKSSSKVITLCCKEFSPILADGEKIAMKIQSFASIIRQHVF